MNLVETLIHGLHGDEIKLCIQWSKKSWRHCKQEAINGSSPTTSKSPPSEAAGIVLHSSDSPPKESKESNSKSIIPERDSKRSSCVGDLTVKKEPGSSLSPGWLPWTSTVGGREWFGTHIHQARAVPCSLISLDDNERWISMKLSFDG